MSISLNVFHKTFFTICTARSVNPLVASTSNVPETITLNKGLELSTDEGCAIVRYHHLWKSIYCKHLPEHSNGLLRRCGGNNHSFKPFGVSILQNKNDFSQKRATKINMNARPGCNGDLGGVLLFTWQFLQHFTFVSSSASSPGLHTTPLGQRFHSRYPWVAFVYYLHYWCSARWRYSYTTPKGYNHLQHLVLLYSCTRKAWTAPLSVFSIHEAPFS